MPSKRVEYILLDMDEVLCDFVGAALKIHGMTHEELDKERKPNEWSIIEPMGLALDSFWQPIHEQGSAFWEKLEPTPWLQELIRTVEYFVSDDWHIVSAPSHCDSSYTGKVRWIKRVFGKHFDRFILTPHKNLFAKADHLLIDDRPKNVVDFITRGAPAILFPTKFNQKSCWAHDPVSHVHLCLEEYFTRRSYV